MECGKRFELHPITEDRFKSHGARTLSPEPCAGRGLYTEGGMDPDALKQLHGIHCLEASKAEAFLGGVYGVQFFLCDGSLRRKRFGDLVLQQWLRSILCARRCERF